MASGTVTGLLTGQPGVTVSAIIHPPGATRISDGSDVVGVSTITDSFGNWTLQLEQAINIDPLSYWEIVEQIPGQSRITAVRVPGNSSYNVQSIRVTNVQFPVLDVAPVPVAGGMTITGGNNQNTPGGTTFGQVLKVYVNDTNNQPVVADQVTFTVITGPNGGLATFPNGQPTYTTTTDLTGTASSGQLTANTTADNFTVVATESQVGVNATFTETISATAVPSAPTVTSATQTAPNTVTINFTPGATNGANVVGYILRVFNGGTQTFVSQASAANPQVLGPSASILVNGQTYTFTLCAVTGTGVQSPQSVASAPVTIVAAPTVPGAPGTPGTLVAGNTQVSATFTAPSSNGGNPITGYTMQAFRVSDNVHVGTDYTGTALTGTVTSLVNGTAVYLQVFATNSVGNGPSSGPSSNVTPATVPGVPTGVAATGGPFNATVTWVAPASNGGSALTGYQVNVYNSGGSTLVTQITGISPSVLSQVVSSLSGDTTYKVTVQAGNAMGLSTESGQVSVTTTLASPTVTGLSPTHGPAGGGTSITVTGTSFDSSATVSVGGNAATAVSVTNATTLTCTTPSGVGGGSVDVIVTTTAGPSTANSSDKFAYDTSSAIPTVTGFDSPFSLPTTGGTINVHGTLFTGASGVKIGSTPVTSFSVTSDTVISMTQSSHTHGFFHVEVTNSVGPSNHTPADLLIFGNPGVGQVSPNSGTTAGGTPITIKGVLLTGATGVTINSNACTNVVVVDANTITCTTPASTGGATGTFDVIVTTPSGTSDTFTPDKFTYTVSTPTPSIQRLIAANTAAHNDVSAALAANVDLLIVQPEQIAGYTQVARSHAASPSMDTLRSQNSDLVIVLYINSTHETQTYLTTGMTQTFWEANAGAPKYNPVDSGPNNTTAWYCYSSGGKKINSANFSIPAWNLMYLQSTGSDGAGHTGWQGYIGAMLNAIRNDPTDAAHRTTGNWNGIFLDVLGDGGSGRNLAINPATGNPFADSFDGGKSWQDVCANGGAAMLAGSGFSSTYICGNSLNNASRYNSVPTSDILTIPASGHISTVMCEQYARTSPNSTPFAIPGTPGNLPSYQTTITMIDDVTRAKGALLWTICKVWSTGADLDVDRWSRVGLAMLLLGGQGYSSIAMQMESAARPATSAFGATNGGAADWTHYTILDCNSTATGSIPGLGQPVDLSKSGIMTDASGIFYRQYQFGYVFLNSLVATVAASSGGTALPTGTINVNNPNSVQFPNTGTLTIVNNAAQTTTTQVAYTGTTTFGGHTTSFTGCTGGTGQLLTDNPIGCAVNIPFGLPSTGGVGWRDVGPAIAGTTGNAHYADAATPSVPAFNALILKVSA